MNESLLKLLEALEETVEFWAALAAEDKAIAEKLDVEE